MRHIPYALVLSFCILAAIPSASSPALAAGPDNAGQKAIPADAPQTADVLEYIRLFGYRQMFQAGAENQLDSVIELVRQSHQDVAPGILDLIHKELRDEVKAATDEAVLEMVPVFQRHLTRADVAYLLSVGRDPRMQKVVALQPKIAEDMDAVGERLAERITNRAAPRIEERLQQLENGQQL
ncbi:MAG: DUF2059 domain-containing protein [Humidesulfovibrio sp.]|nr:DUF2059 domain-containing protein [Humidesulfovibrio sp.]